MMKILMVTPSYKPIVGGTETVVSNLTKMLNKRGIKTDIMTFAMNEKWHAFKRWEIKQDDSATVYRVPGYRNAVTSILNRLGVNLHFLPSLKFIKIATQYDIIHFHDVIDLSFPFLSFFIRKPTIFHCHTLSESIELYQNNAINRYILRNCADIYICIGVHTKELLFDLGIKDSQVNIVPNGVDVQKFIPGGKKEDNLILYHGRITRRKGLHVLLQALPYLKNSVQLIISGIVSDREYLNEIRGLVSKFDDSHHSVKYLGPVDTVQLISLYQKSSIFVCPSLREEFGIVNLEAMACKTPVIATNVGNIPDIVDHMKNGILVPPGDPIKLAEAIDYLLENEQERIRFSEEARKKVVKYFSWDVIIDKLYDIYQSIVRGSKEA